MKPKFSNLLLVASIVLNLSSSAHAASGTWTGSTDTTWAGANWSTTPVPGTGDTATFNAASGNTTINLGAGVIINSILFDTANAAAYTIGSGAVNSQTLTLDTAGGAIKMSSTVTKDELFNSALVLGAAANASTFTVTNNSLSNSLTFAGSITGATGTGAKTLAVAGAGNTVMSGVIGNGATGTVALAKSGLGTWTLNGATANSYTGGTKINGGVLLLDFSNFAGVSNLIASQALTMGGGTLSIQGKSTIANTQAVTTLSSSSGTSSKILLTPGASGGTVGLTVANALAAPVLGTLQLSATGTTTLSANLSSTFLLSGTVTFGTDNFAATSAGGVVSAAAMSPASTNWITGVINDITGSFSTTGASISPLAIRFADSTGRTASISTSTMTSPTILVASTAGVSALNGAGFLRSFSNGANRDFNVIQNSANDFSIGAPLSNPGSSGSERLVKSGSGRLILTNTGNSYSLGTYINEGIVSIAANGSLGAVGAAVTLNGGTLQSTAAVALFDGVSTYRGVTVNSNGGSLDALASGNTLTVGGVVTGAGLLSINSGAGAAGTVILSAGNNNSGGTNVKAGTLQINGINALGGSNYGGLTLNGGTLKYVAGFTGNGSGDLTSIGTASVTLAAGSGTIDVNGNAVTYAGSIGNGGTGALTVKSTLANGSLTLGSANTYTGGTTISSGVLNITNTSGSATGTGAVSLGAGTLTGTGALTGSLTTTASSIITPGTSGVGVITLGDVTLLGNTTINYGLDAGTPTANYISAGTLTLPSSGTVLLNLYTPGTNNPFASAGTYDLFKYTSLAGGSYSSAFSFGTSITGYTPSFATSGGFLQLILTAAGVNGSWTNGTANSNWTDSGNWTGGVPSLAGSTATFASAPGAVTLNANETVGSATFNNASSYTISGANTLTLDNSGSGAFIFVTNGAHDIQSAVALNDTTTASVSAGKTLTISGNISNTSGSKTLLINGAGTVILSGNNSYGPSAGSVGTTLSAGTLQVGSNSALGAGDLAVTAASSLQAGGSVNLANAIGISNGVTLTADSQANTFTLGGAISDNAGAGGGTAVLSKIGNGTLILNGVNTYGGGTTLTAGTLQVNSASSLGASTGNLTFNGGTLQLGATIASTTRNYVVTSGKTAIIDTNSFDLTTSGVISSVGTTTGSNVDGLAKNGAGNLTLSTANTFTGQTVINGGTLTLGTALALQTSTLNYASQGGTLSFGSLTAATMGGLTGSQALALTNSSSGNVALTVGGTNLATTFSGNLSGGGSFSKIGTATTTLSNAAYSGNTIVYNGGLTLNGSTNLTTHLDISAQQGVANVLIDGATVNATGGLYITSSTGGSGTIFGNRATLVINNGAQVTASADANGRAISYGATNTARPGGNGSLTIGTSGDTTTSVTANGALDMFFSAGGGTVGNFTVNLDGGTLAVQKIQETTTNATQTGTFKFNGGVLKALQSTTTFMSPSTGFTASVLAGGAKINTNGFDVTVGAVLATGVASDGGLTKSGGGTLTLANTNTYVGATTVNAGKLLVNGSLNTNSAVTAQNSGSTIGGTGTINGNLTVKSGAILAAGDSTVNAGVETLAVGNGSSTLTMEAGSVFSWDLNGNTDSAASRGVAGGYDGVDVTGALSIDAASVFRVVLGAGVGADPFWSTSHSWSDIFGGAAYTGGFVNSLLEVVNTSGATYDQSTLNVAGGGFSITGSTLTWSAVPEPTSALAGILLGAGLLRRKRAVVR